MVTRWAEQQSFMARRFFLASVFQAIVCLALALGLAWLFKVPAPTKNVELPVSFQASTAFLGLGSWFLHRAWNQVKLERQTEFRRSLAIALACAVLFVSVQSFGLWGFMKSTNDYRNPQQNTHGFVFMFAVLHGMHFVVAQSVLLWVTLAARYDRYDHEYYFGVTFATWFWHLLGIAWVAILFVFATAGGTYKGVPMTVPVKASAGVMQPSTPRSISSRGVEPFA